MVRASRLLSILRFHESLTDPTVQMNVDGLLPSWAVDVLILNHNLAYPVILRGRVAAHVGLLRKQVREEHTQGTLETSII